MDPNTINWAEFDGPSGYDPSRVEDALAMLLGAQTQRQAQAAYNEVLSAVGNNHAGTMYPAAVEMAAILREFRQQGLAGGPGWAAAEVLIDLGESFAPEPGYETTRLPSGVTCDVLATVRVLATHGGTTAVAQTLRRAEALFDKTSAVQVAEGYGDDIVFPDQIVVDRFPGWPDDVLVLSIENQGVCAWGLSLGTSHEGAVVVAGDLIGDDDTVVYCDDLEIYLATRQWDRRCLRPPLLQAQAAQIDPASVEYLEQHFEQRWTTRGWPCPENLRFERDGLKVMLWSCAGQCDWWISGSPTELGAILSELSALSNLSTALWSNDTLGQDLLRTLHSRGSGS
ncbi:MAG: hypothetical protein GY701_32915 [Sulfitobacter sp.]|nr:hypothetical protein [Sulfitobacter sp.]